MATAQGSQSITVVITGVLASGKTTLLNTLFDQTCKTAQGAEPVTTEFYKCQFTRNNVTIQVIDTPGLEGTKKENKKLLKKTSSYTEGKADILVYCLPVDSSHRFTPSNPIVMKSLQKAYGRKIWQHCLLVFTWSNRALEEFKTKHGSDAEDLYKGHIEEYARAFETELTQKLNVNDVTVTTIFSDKEPNGIVAIPAGRNADDPVLPGIISDNWKEEVLDEMIACNPDHIQTLLRYRHKCKVGKAKTLAVDMVSGAPGVNWIKAMRKSRKERRLKAYEMLEKRQQVPEDQQEGQEDQQEGQEEWTNV